MGTVPLNLSCDQLEQEGRCGFTSAVNFVLMFSNSEYTSCTCLGEAAHIIGRIIWTTR